MNLSRSEVRWAELIGRTLIPRGSVGGTSDGVQIGEALAGEVRGSTWYIGLLIRFGLWAVWFAPPFVLGRLRHFGSLDEGQRCTTLERLLATRVYALRMAVSFLKIALCGQLLGDHAFLARLDAYDVRPRATSTPVAEPQRSTP